MKENFTKHHIYPKSRDGSNAKHNSVYLPDSKHKALHKLFRNKTPIEQLRLLVNINLNSLSEEFSDEIKRLLDFWEGEEMKDWILINK